MKILMTDIKQTLPLLLILVMTACSEGRDVDRQAAEPVTPNWSNEPPGEGQCLGWRQSLSEGEYEKLSQVEKCLQGLVKNDRAASVPEFSELLEWNIEAFEDSDLEVLAHTVVNFPQPGELEGFLNQLGVLSGQGFGDDDEFEDDPLTVLDHLYLDGRIAWFDVETGFFPNQHDYLLADLAALSDSELNQARFEEVPPKDYDTDEDPYLLKAVVGQKTYQIKAENYGDWYDVSAVLNLLNGIAMDHALSERFVSLPTGDQTAIVLAIDEPSLERLLGMKVLRLDNPQQHVLSSKQLEQLAIDKLLDEEQGE